MMDLIQNVRLQSPEPPMKNSFLELPTQQLVKPPSGDPHSVRVADFSLHQGSTQKRSLSFVLLCIDSLRVSPNTLKPLRRTQDCIVFRQG